MCTVSWVHEGSGYHLLCNRDEKRTRGAGVGPRIGERGGVRFVAPADSDHGGTWLAANEFGISLCLLNGAAAGPRAATRSRGLPMRDLIGAGTLDDAALCLTRLDLARYAPFTLLFLAPGARTAVAAWNGCTLEWAPDAEAARPLTSSSFDAEGVKRTRLEEFARRVPDADRVLPADLYWFHASHGAGPDAYWPCMHRADAETVSFSWVVVTEAEIRFLYSPAALCRPVPGEQQVLARAA